jgi:hypothetical protein
VLKAFGWISLLLAIAALIGGGVMWFLRVPCWRCVITPNRYHPDPGPGYSGSGTTNSSPLRSLASAQADFRANDRDGNGMNDFWRKDIAGFYAMPGVDGKPLKLIELSTALADERPVWALGGYGISGPRRGYWYRAILHEDENPAKPDPQRFAYVGYPADFPRHYKYTYVIDEKYAVFRAELPFGQKVTTFPGDLTNWSKLD